MRVDLYAPFMWRRKLRMEPLRVTALLNDSSAQSGEFCMLDLIFLAAIVAFFAVGGLFVLGCERL